MGLRKMNRLLLILLLADLTLAWSKRHPKPTSEDHAKALVEPESSSEEVDSSEEAIESKLTAHYTPQPKARQYILEEDDHHYQPHDSANGGGEYIDSEDLKSHIESDESEGHHDSDSTKKDDEYKEFSEKGAHQEFEQGGASFDKHAKDHKIDNKEVENIKQHDVGANYGGEAVKEHKLGKHRDKSIGHKTHGFKNVYHKEEYGDHKTFHDEFLDKDSLHDYDDHHEHKEMKGGKFSKGLKHEGKNKKFDKGDEKHQWGKSGYDGSHEGKYDKGRHSTKHHQGTKKRKGHHQADLHNKKYSVHKIKKGNPPAYSPQVGHHGPHQAQIQPYVPHHHSHNVYKEHVPIVHKESYHDHPEDHIKDDYPHDHDDYRNSHEVNYDSKEHHNDDHSTYGSEYRSHHGGQHHPDHHHSGHHNQHHRNHHHHHHSSHHPNQQQEEHDFPQQHEIEAEERIAKKHHSKNTFGKQVEGMYNDGIAQNQEQFNQPQTRNFQPSYHSGFLPYMQHPRRPSFESRNRKQFHDDEYQKRYHRILFGEDKPRNYHHHSNHPRHHSQSPTQLHGHHHGHHKHDAYKPHPTHSKNYDQSLDARAHSQEHLTLPEEQNDRRQEKAGLRRN
ncbi:histidine-rich glycoprotein-like [Uloborus diversus]|uniref:histidine-rich glycoprotein-like n=1 Tax=Uloborus diversus TaxID=327109 RepID=UPI002408F994|nr:histidine-rich glycoprotein-like [Uloborus diversus]